MRAIVIVTAFVIVLACAYIADTHWYDGSHSRMVIHSLRVVFMVLVNNW
jgi:hypothetical protein